jgi:hypothetical protein
MNRRIEALPLPLPDRRALLKLLDALLAQNRG